MKKRYVVRLKAGREVYRGNSRFLAWLTWLVFHKHEPQAFDLNPWIDDSNYWLDGQHSSLPNTNSRGQ